MVENKRTAETQRGEDVASFYRCITTGPVTEPMDPDVIIISDDEEGSTKGKRRIGNEEGEICSVCGLQVPRSPLARRRHIASTAHLSKLSTSDPVPLNPLPIDKTSYGYKVLYSQGWSEKHRHGIGAEGNEGRREPVKASRVKNDTVGLGVKEKKIKEAVIEKKLKEKGRDIRKRYEQDKMIRKELMDYFRS